MDAQSVAADLPPAIDFDRPWHALSTDAVLAELGCDADGLTDEQARRRRARYGPNQLTASRKTHPVVRFIKQFHNVLLYIMTIAAVITAFLGHWVDTGVLLGAVIVNAVIAFVQEGKAESALDAIRALLPPRATVIRGGRPVDIDAGGGGSPSPRWTSCPVVWCGWSPVTGAPPTSGCAPRPGCSPTNPR